MKFQKIHLFLILILALLFCSFLGGFTREAMTSGVVIEGPKGNKGVVAKGPAGNTYVATSQTTNNGISGKDIPPGDEDLYILKSEIVPPVCPACPQAAACPRQKPCEPCPPCARCPEPAYECKLVPNYSSSNDDALPRPVLADFSQFGM